MRLPEGTRREGSERTPYAELLAFSDEQLVTEMLAGNTDAFAVIFKRYYRIVNIVALRVLFDAGEAEDLAQTIFLEIYKKMGEFDPSRGTFKVWVLQRAQSRSVNRFNYLLVRKFHKQVELAAVDEQAGVWSPRKPPTEELRQVTNEILSALPEAQRQTIELHLFEGLSLKEIACRRDETLSNVCHQYYRGLDRLRSYWEKGIRRDSNDPSVVPTGEA
jgi:RNA polymerase sigma-70 factor, ECF subfamily